MRSKTKIPVASVAGSMLAALAVAFAPRVADASGFFLTERGVRSLGRGGAFVAGADDAHSVWFNPAGLAHAGRSFLVDASYIGFSATYTRRAVRTDAMGMPVLDAMGNPAVAQYGPVRSSQAPLAIPTLAVTHNFGLQRWNFAFSLFAPNAVIPTYPDSLAPSDPNGRFTAPSPQRYSLYTLNGSLLAMAGLYASFKPSEILSVGAGILALTGTFNARVALTGCPATITCQPENPEWDAEAQIEAGPIFAPTAALGVQISPVPALRIGISGQLPLWVDAPAKLRVRLPSHPFYTNSDPNNPTRTEGDSAAVNFVLAPVVRAGVEVRPTQADRIEAAFTWEAWDVHDAINLRPTGSGIRIVNVRGVGTYEIGPQRIERGWQSAFSVRLGYERFQPLPNGWKIVPRVGFSFDTSASPDAYTSVMTLDAMKVLGTAGVGFGRGGWRIDASFAYAYMPSINVDPAAARIPQVAPFRQSPQASRVYVNGGLYEMSSFVLGLGFNYAW
jgi:long-chain fatty acid transport protein